MASPSVDNNAPKQSDARGLLIPDDIVRNSNYLKSDPATFWSSHQFYIKGNNTEHHAPNPESILKLLSAIPDHHFSKIQSLCLDLGWKSPLNFPDWRNSQFGRSFERLMRNILHRGNDELLIKILWSHTSAGSQEQFDWEKWWEDDENWYGHVMFNGQCDGFLNFKDHARSWGFGPNRIRLIAKMNWKNEEEWADPKYDEEYKKKIFEIDPISEDVVWKELWKSSRISQGLRWDPIQGHL